jgi:hypothetical protein
MNKRLELNDAKSIVAFVFVPVAFAPAHADGAVFLEKPFEKLYVLDLT